MPVKCRQGDDIKKGTGGGVNIEGAVNREKKKPPYILRISRERILLSNGQIKEKQKLVVHDWIILLLNF